MSNVTPPLHCYGLIGYPLGHSLSQELYEERSELRHTSPYILHPIRSLDLFEEVVIRQAPLGLNVTSPYKAELLNRYTKKIIASDIVQKLGASNCLALYYQGEEWVGAYAYNTDVYGFRESLRPLIRSQYRHALILGTGGASRAVGYALEELGIVYYKATRGASRRHEGLYNYSELKQLPMPIDIIINATSSRDATVPSRLLTYQPLCYDLHYVRGEFLQEAERHGCPHIGGLEMLRLQAELSWQIWAKHLPLQLQESTSLNFGQLSSRDELTQLDRQ